MMLTVAVVRKVMKMINKLLEKRLMNGMMFR
jgi:hypothetical protein